MTSKKAYFEVFNFYRFLPVITGKGLAFTITKNYYNYR